MRANRISRGIAANVYDKMIVAGVQLVLVPILVLHWGLTTYGAWILLATIPTFLAASDFGFATAAGTQMIMLVAQDKKSDAVRVFQSAWAVILPTSAFVLLVALLCCWLTPIAMYPRVKDLTPFEMRLALCLLIVYGLASLQGSIFNAGFRCSGLFALGTFWLANTFLIENVALIIAVFLGAGPVGGGAALLGGRLFCLGIQNVLLRKHVPWLRVGLSEATRDTIRSIFRPAVAVMMLPLSQASFLQGTAIALGAAAGPAAVPAFTATRTLSRIGLQMTQLAVHAIMPEYSAAVARGDRNGQALMLTATLASAAAILIPFSLILAIFGPQLVSLWTKGEIVAPHSLMIAMAVTVILGGFWNPLSNLILAMNRHASFSYPFALFAVLTIPASYMLSLHFSATGAALSIVLMDTAMLIVIVRIGRRLFVRTDEIFPAVSGLFQHLFQLLHRIRS